jgi:hypothetical protein
VPATASAGRTWWTPRAARSGTRSGRDIRPRSGGCCPGPGTARVYTYPGARGGRLIADVVRLDKGHTEGLEPHVTESLVTMMLAAPGGKLRAATASPAATPTSGASGTAR